MSKKKRQPKRYDHPTRGPVWDSVMIAMPAYLRAVASISPLFGTKPISNPLSLKGKDNGRA